MIKIECVFVVDRAVNMATRQVNPNNSWVFDGEGTASIKYDGTSCMIQNNQLYKRWNRKLKKPFVRQFRQQGADFVWQENMFREPPVGAIACADAPAFGSLHWPYWIPVTKGEGNENLHYLSAFAKQSDWQDGTYELVGPQIQGNLYQLNEAELRRHGAEEIQITDLSFDGLRDLLSSMLAEGIVWKHPDGRMAKLRRDHFNFAWGEPDPRDDQLARARFIP